MAELLNGFSAISNEQARVLILGSMPGKRSLQLQQYYAHPRNLFWPIMADLLQFPESLQYEQRTEQLIKKRIALWDVLQNCERESSLDSDIKSHSIKPNDFRQFLNAHGAIRAVLFNGKKSEEIFKRHVKQTLDNSFNPDYLAMPSTSPANAAISKKEKIRRWSVLLDYL